MNDLPKNMIEDHKPLREVVFEYLREAILEGKYEPGKRLMEIQLAEELGVSRTPIREAIRKLELEGLVIMVPRRGAYVTEVLVDDMVEVLEIRGALEGLAASLAAERMTDIEIDKLKKTSYEFKKYHLEKNIKGMIEKDIEIHERIFSSAGNKRLYQMSQNLREQVYRFRVRYISEYNRSEELVEDHQKIVDAISERNKHKAYISGLKHIENLSRHMVKEMLSEEKVTKP